VKKILFALIGILVIAAFISGCKKDTAPNTTIPAGDATNPVAFKDCNEFCQAKPHTDCVGTWTVSGSLPGCSCEFTCTTETPADLADDTKVYSKDNQFYVQVGENNPVTGGYATYFPGDDKKAADRVIIGGSSIAKVKTIEVYYTSGTKAPSLKAIMHKYELDGKTVFDSSLKNAGKGMLSFKIYGEDDKIIETGPDFKVGIIPKIV
jgi:hypothetical protein